MALSFDYFALLLLLAPFVAAVLAPVISRETGKAAGWILAIVPAGLFATFVTYPPTAHGTRIVIDWVPALDLQLSFLIDGLSLTFTLLITGIGTFIILYSAAYLEGHAHRGRFLAFVFLFMGAMLGLVLSDSLVGLFVFWELTSVTSFLLIGFDHERESARRGAIQALIVTGVGGLSLLAGAVLLHAITGTWMISELALAEIPQWAQWLYPVVLALVFLAAFTKSAQWPFHFWLPNAMEAPTPVSAYLHSATMVQAGVYLLARLSPLLAGTLYWQVPLCTVGAITLLWGSIVALRQTDLKQVLAQTTIASLGLLVLLLGIGGETAALAVAIYFVAHALYKAALFLVAGIIEHGTGTRDITQLGGLRDTLTISFICTGVAALSMFGAPPLLGYLAKESIYAALGYADAWSLVVLAAVVIGNAVLGAVALALLIRPFMGALKPTPQAPHEGSVSLWIGPALLGLATLGVMFALTQYSGLMLAPMAGSIVGGEVETELVFLPHLDELPIWLSLASWLLGLAIYWQLDNIRSALAAVEARWSWTWDRGFDQAMFSLIRIAGAWTRTIHHGRLELYLLVIVALLIFAVALPLALLGDLPTFPRAAPLNLYEWGAFALTVAGVATVVAARTRLGAIVALGIQGVGVALIFLFFGAPDLAFTQFMVEVLSVVIFALVMTRLNLSAHDRRVFEDWLRDGGLALATGAGVTVLLMRILEGTLDTRLSSFFGENSVPIAHGHNIVNVILVDFRGLDTLGEISVVMAAGIAVLALLRRQHKRMPSQATAAGRVRPRKAAA